MALIFIQWSHLGFRETSVFQQGIGKNWPTSLNIPLICITVSPPSRPYTAYSVGHEKVTSPARSQSGDMGDCMLLLKSKPLSPAPLDLAYPPAELWTLTPCRHSLAALLYYQLSLFLILLKLPYLKLLNKILRVNRKLNSCLISMPERDISNPF